MSTTDLYQQKWRVLLAALAIAVILMTACMVAGSDGPTANGGEPPHLAGPHDDFGG